MTPPTEVTVAAVVEVPRATAPDLLASESAHNVRSPALVVMLGVAAVVIEPVALTSRFAVASVTVVVAASSTSPP